MEKLVESLAHRLLDKLPGKIAHQRLAPFPSRLDELPSAQHRKAAVMIVLMSNEENNLIFPLIQRNPLSDHDPHKGQMALPGGRMEDHDQHLAFTALRETEEEIGLSAKDIKIIGALSPLYIPVSQNLVHPFIGWYAGKNEYIKQDDEIYDIFECPIDFYKDSNLLQFQKINTSYAQNLSVPGFQIGDQWIWGATGMILSEFEMILKEL